MIDQNCPKCGANIIETADEDGVGMCIQCGWVGDLDDAAVDTSSPFDVRGEPPHSDNQNGDVVIHISKTETIRLSPQKAENLAEVSEHAARNARDHREPDDSPI